jgi:hypothetical protein
MGAALHCCKTFLSANGRRKWTTIFSAKCPQNVRKMSAKCPQNVRKCPQNVRKWTTFLSANGHRNVAA